MNKHSEFFCWVTPSVFSNSVKDPAEMLPLPITRKQGIKRIISPSNFSWVSVSPLR